MIAEQPSEARLTSMRAARALFPAPDSLLFAGARMTPRRIQNLIQMREDRREGRASVQSYPISLSLESVNACNLRCPGCFTGSGAVGRPRSLIPLPLFRSVLSEMGPYLLNLELHNWGEPLLHPDLPEMIGFAHELGVATTVSTNFSLTLSDERLDELVRSGLSLLVVSIDGATQPTYERYRKRGRLNVVLDNCHRMTLAKKRAGRSDPHMIWAFHVFEYNVQEIAAARALARDLEMQLGIEKGWTIGEEWDGGGVAGFTRQFQHQCWFLWEHATVNNDGGVSVCAASYFTPDDVGRTAEDGPSFFSIWNGPQMQAARALFDNRDPASHARDLACFDCPVTLNFEKAKREQDFLGGFTSGNDVINYHWRRGSKFETGDRLVQIRSGRIPG